MKIASITPWIVKAEGTFFGEFLFVEVQTDEGVTGWGEVTTSTRASNRALASTLRVLN